MLLHGDDPSTAACVRGPLPIAYRGAVRPPAPALLGPFGPINAPQLPATAGGGSRAPQLGTWEMLTLLQTRYLVGRDNNNKTNKNENKRKKGGGKKK